MKNINKINRSVYRLASDFCAENSGFFELKSDKDGILQLQVHADWDGEEYTNVGRNLYYKCFSSHDVRTMFVQARRSVHQYWFKKYGHYIWSRVHLIDDTRVKGVVSE